jgi:tripartite ATP-independent transporter DctM subunit
MESPTSLVKSQKRIGQLSQLTGYGAILGTVLLTLLVFSEIVCRFLFNFSLAFSGQVSEWLLVAIVFLGGAWALKEGSHVSIEIMTNRFSKETQCYLKIVLSFTAFATLLTFSYYTWEGLAEVYTRGIKGSSVYQLPKFPIYFIYTFGNFMIALQFLAIFMGALSTAKEFPRNRFKISQLLPAAIFMAAIIFLAVTYSSWKPAYGTSRTFLLVLLMGGAFFFLLNGTWIFLALAGAGGLGLLIFTKYPVGKMVAQMALSANESFTLTCLPLFVLMGEVLFRSGASKNLYMGISPWVTWLPGRLLHSNVITCSIFAAVSGSSAVTCATIGTVAVPELKKLGYDEGVTIGSIAGAGTLGLLIPPSIILIIYGAITSQSIGQLFMAGIVPGIMLALMFMIYIAALSIFKPHLAPPVSPMSFPQKIKATVKILPMIAVIVMVLVFIYTGVTTPTEAGSIGSIAAIIVAAGYRKLNWHVLSQSLRSTVMTTVMIMFIVTGANIISNCMAYLRIPQELVTTIEAAQLDKYTLLLIMCVMYMGLGCLFDGVSMMLLTLPITFPLITSWGFNPIWFGIILTVLIETAQITPPVGFNLYVLKNISGKQIGEIVRHTIPFFLIMAAAVLILIVWPEIPFIIFK